jgi:DNA-binding response OmpR family regulator
MRILLVDDEQSLLQLLGQVLARAGHESIRADSFAAALELLQKDPGPLDAAVIDLSLPDGSGEEIARVVLAFHPAIRIVIATGYAYDPPKDLLGKVDVLLKPFPSRALLNVLTRADVH